MELSLLATSENYFVASCEAITHLKGAGPGQVIGIRAITGVNLVGVGQPATLLHGTNRPVLRSSFMMPHTRGQTRLTFFFILLLFPFLFCLFLVSVSCTCETCLHLSLRTFPRSED